MHVDRRSFVRFVAGAFPMGRLLGGWNVRGYEEPKPRGPVRVHVWCEGTAPRSVYPDDIHGALAEQLGRLEGVQVTRGCLGDPNAGLADATLDATDVLIWWGRLRHDEVPDERAASIVRRVQEGRLGFVALYASCCSKPFKQMMNMSCELGSWREDGRPEHVSIQSPDHPIARGISPFTISKTDMFAEPFAVPEPDTVVLVSSWDHGETMRSGLTWTVGRGRVAYLRTGPEHFPILFHPSIRQVIANTVPWAAGRV
jgi:trehalose utilization protein